MIRPASICRIAVFSLCCLVLFSCAPRQVLPPDADIRAEERWQAFRSASEGICPEASFRLRGSLNYITPGRKGRAVMTMWGNIGGAVRMDAASSFGSVELLLREEGEEILAYVPSERTAYIGLDKKAALGNLGVPSELSLQDVALVSMGCFHKILPERYASFTYLDGNSIRYAFEGERYVSAVINADNTLQSLQGLAGDMNAPAWTMAFQDRDDDEDLTARRLFFQQGEKTQLTLRIKEQKSSASRLSDQGLLLSLPEGTNLKRISK
jgi:hypothetical protein